MNPPDFGVWRRTSPFAIVFFLGATVRTIARSYIQLVASFGAIAYLTRFDFASRGSSLGPAILLILFAIGGVALLRYWFFRFRVEDDRILIRQGFIKRTALDLPFDRVQGINVERSLVDRMLGLVTVRLDTAGTVVAEGRLPAVSTELADWLRTRVDRGRRGRRASPGTGEDDRRQPGDRDRVETPDHARHTAETPAAADQVLLKLTGGDMLRIGLADRKALVLAGALAALAQVAEPFQDMIAGIVDAVWSGITGLAAVTQVIAVLVLFLTIALVLVTAVVIGAFLRHHDYTLWRRGTAFRSRGGLLTQKGVVVETAKIQQLTLSQNLILRWFGRFRFSALPAGAIQTPGSEGPANLEFAENLTVPLLDGTTAESLRRQVFGREATKVTILPGSPRFTRVSPYYVRALTLRMCVVPILGGTFFLLLRGTPSTILSVPFGVFCLAAVALSGAVALQSWRRRGYLHDDEGLASRRGFLGARVDAFLFRKVQSVSDETVTAAAPQGPGHTRNAPLLGSRDRPLRRTRHRTHAAGLHSLQSGVEPTALALTPHCAVGVCLAGRDNLRVAPREARRWAGKARRRAHSGAIRPRSNAERCSGYPESETDMTIHKAFLTSRMREHRGPARMHRLPNAAGTCSTAC